MLSPSISNQSSSFLLIAPSPAKHASIDTAKFSLSHDNQLVLKKLLITVAKGEKSIELQRQMLAARKAFEPHAAFQRLDRGSNGKLGSLDLLKFLR